MCSHDKRFRVSFSKAKLEYPKGIKAASMNLVAFGRVQLCFGCGAIRTKATGKKQWGEWTNLLKYGALNE